MIRPGKSNESRSIVQTVRFRVRIEVDAGVKSVTSRCNFSTLWLCQPKRLGKCSVAANQTLVKRVESQTSHRFISFVSLVCYLSYSNSGIDVILNMQSSYLVTQSCLLVAQYRDVQDLVVSSHSASIVHFPLLGWFW
jgi:hypothetical protein